MTAAPFVAGVGVRSVVPPASPAPESAASPVSTEVGGSRDATEADSHPDYVRGSGHPVRLRSNGPRPASPRRGNLHDVALISGRCPVRLTREHGARERVVGAVSGR